MTRPDEILLGTHNVKKRIELEGLLLPHAVKVRTLAETKDPMEVVEDGDSFQANATKKAVQQALHLGCWVLGEDSGLVVDALGGAPGIYSARYAGEEADDEANNQHLLAELANVPIAKRTAHYVCHMTLSNPAGQVQVDCEAVCRGRIRREPSGTYGFGYDPLFEVIEFHATFGELGPAVKAVISHRAKAMRVFLSQLLRISPGPRVSDA